MIHDPVKWKAEHTTAYDMEVGETAYCGGPGEVSFIRTGETVKLYLLWNLPLLKSAPEEGEFIPITRLRDEVAVPKRYERRIRERLQEEEARGFLHSMNDEWACLPVVFT